MIRYPCERCPLRGMVIFRDFTADELRFISGFKSGELVVERGTCFLAQGSSSAYIYTVLSGWGFRYKDLEDGRRQILNFVFPGELVGLQGAILREMEHSVEALTDMMLCVFERRRLWELYNRHPELAYDITWLAAREERILEEHLTNVGRRTAKERLATLVLHIFDRAERAGLTEGNSFNLPLTQQHVADTLGMSLVHTNKTLRRLHSERLISWTRRRLTLVNRDGLVAAAGWSGLSNQVRPLI